MTHTSHPQTPPQLDDTQVSILFKITGNQSLTWLAFLLYNTIPALHELKDQGVWTGLLRVQRTW